jgi:hypothetical protein
MEALPPAGILAGTGVFVHAGTETRSLDMETAWRITAPVVAGLLGLGYTLMRVATDDYLQIGARLCFAFAGLWLGVVGFMWLIHTPTSLPYRLAAGLGIGAVVFVAVPLLMRLAWPPEDAMAQSNNPPPVNAGPIVNQGPGSVFTNEQKGGVAIGTVFMGPAKRDLSQARTEPLKQQMLSEFPRDKPIRVIGLISDGESIDFAREIHAFLKQNGFIMKEPGGITQSIFSGAPKGVQVRTEANGDFTVIVGAAE